MNKIRFLKLTFSFLFLALFFLLPHNTQAGTIDSVSYTSYLCSDSACTAGSKIIWKTSNGTAVNVTDTVLTGHIWGENVGWISLNPTKGGVVNTTGGILSGYAWGENTGWINFKPQNGGVVINTSTGEFLGYAWSQNYGWIKFDCSAGANFCVKTGWRPPVSTTSGGSTGPIVNPVLPPIVPPVNPPVNPPVFPVNPPPEILPPVNPPIVPPVNPPPVIPINPPISPLAKIGGAFSSSVSAISTFLNNANSPIKGLLDKTFTPEEIVQIDIGLKITAVISAIVAGTVSLATVLFLNPLSFSEMILIPFRLWSLLLTALGLRKRIKPWGTVYDSITKQPLDPVYVSLINLEGEEVSSCITDIDGRYGFYMEPGVYKIVPKKTNYIFPSHALANNFRDEFYQDLYFGDYLNIAEGQIIVNNIPMDPVNFDWNEFAKNKKQLFKFYSKKELIIARISNILFNFGFSIAGIALIVSPEKYNIVIFSLYILMFFLRRTKFKIKAKGRVFDKDGLPLSFAFIRVCSSATDVEITHKVVDKMGRYHILVPNGKYYVKIEKKNDDGSYSLVYKSEEIEVVHGTLNKIFNI